MKRLTAQALNAPGIAHGFFGREGGVSAGLYESLNCGPGSSDDPEAVSQNRRLVAAALMPDTDTRLISLSQIHSAIVHPLPAWDAPSREGSARLEGDAMVTATPGLALGILTADCAPVLLADPKAKVIGAAHAGWKGALGKDGRGVLEATLDAMEKLGALRDRIQAAIGPCISQSNYEVAFDFRDRFLELGLRHRRFFTPSDREGHYRFDLQGYVAHRLTSAGVGAVEPLGFCTYPAENGFFSFRRTTHAKEPDYGRQISAIVLTG
ncbi:MAG TPA: peptidoglycan editing factor PgeF [Rhizomicrobium sp.]|nr:peptidoglycan editing factor PgeF [Rhizomicrobium sp.]